MTTLGRALLDTLELTLLTTHLNFANPSCLTATDLQDGTKWINPKKRPTHKLKFLIGKKVDTIEYGRQHLAEIIPKIQVEQDKHWNGEGDLVGAVFLEFATQKDAQDAWVMMNSRKTKPNKKMAARQLGVNPQEVVWSNLRISVTEHWARWAAATAFITVMIIFFAIPVAFVGLVSNINYLADRFTWLEWILKIPKVILGIVTGLLPVVMLAVLMALVPIVCRCKFFNPQSTISFVRGISPSVSHEAFTNINSDGQTCWIRNIIPSRASDARMVLRLPGYSGFLDHHLRLCSYLRRQHHPQRSWPGRDLLVD